MDELSTVAHDALMRYKGFVIIWVEPPISAHEWVLNINPAERAGLTKLSRTKVIKGATLEEAKDEARKFIDDLLASRKTAKLAPSPVRSESSPRSRSPVISRKFARHPQRPSRSCAVSSKVSRAFAKKSSPSFFTASQGMDGRTVLQQIANLQSIRRLCADHLRRQFLTGVRRAGLWADNPSRCSKEFKPKGERI